MTSTPQPPQAPQSQTLAQLLADARYKLHLSESQLAEEAMISEQLVLDLEAGVERVVSPLIRQRLARALKLSPLQIARLAASTGQPNRGGTIPLKLQQQIWANPTAKHLCPSCEGGLVVRLFERYDLENNLIKTIKAHCSQCIYQASVSI